MTGIILRITNEIKKKKNLFNSLQMMIADRQNREKSLPRRRKKDIIKDLQRDATNQDEDDEDEEEEDETDRFDNKKEEMNEAISETTEALTVFTYCQISFGWSKF